MGSVAANVVWYFATLRIRPLLSITIVFLVSFLTRPEMPLMLGSVLSFTETVRHVHSWARMFCGVIGIYDASLVAGFRF